MNASPEKARAIFEQALELKTAEERSAFVERACQGQPELREEVESLLLAHQEAGDFLCSTVLTTPPEPPAEQAGIRIGRRPGGGCGAASPS